MQCVPIRPKVSFRSALVSLYRITGLLKALPTCGLCLFKGLYSFWIKFQTAVSTFFSLSFFSSLNVMLILVVLLFQKQQRCQYRMSPPVTAGFKRLILSLSAEGVVKRVECRSSAVNSSSDGLKLRNLK